MEACLTSKKLQCLLTLKLSGNNTKDLRSCSRNLTSLSSFSTNISLQTRPFRRLSPVMQFHVPPLPSNEDSNDVKSIKQINAGDIITTSATMVVVLACTVGALCSGLTGKAHASTWSWHGEKASDSTRTTKEINLAQEKSIEALWQIFQKKTEPSVYKSAQMPMALFDILHDLVDRHELNKDYLSHLRITEKGDSATNLLYNEWASKDNAYEIGLLLTDILINQGDYERADLVCRKLESYDASKFDVRPQIRRVVINLMQIEDAIGAEVKETDKVRKLKKKNGCNSAHVDQAL